ADLLYVHQSLGMYDIIFHERQQVSAAAKDLSLSPIRTQQADGLIWGGGSGELEGSHHAPAFWPNAVSTRSGVSGRNGTRTPIAFATAFEIAAPGEITGGSPSPMTPRSSYPLPVIMWTTSSGMSLSPARRYHCMSALSMCPVAESKIFSSKSE